MKCSTGKPLQLGITLLTERAKHALVPQEVLAALWTHAHEPWGERFDPQSLEEPQAKEDRSLSSRHVSSSGHNFRITTEEGVTTVCLTDEQKPFETISVDRWILSGCPTCGG